MSKIQKWQREQLRARGVDIRVLKGPEAVNEFIKEVMPL